MKYTDDWFNDKFEELDKYAHLVKIFSGELKSAMKELEENMIELRKAFKEMKL